jgi:hypothetical protein
LWDVKKVQHFSPQYVSVKEWKRIITRCKFHSLSLPENVCGPKMGNCKEVEEKISL